MSAQFRLLLVLSTVFCILINMISHQRSGQAAQVPSSLKEVGITEHLKETIPFDQISLTDEQGHEKVFSSYFKKDVPVLLNLVYYECPSLCNLLLNGLVDTLKKVKKTPGKDFEVITVSIHPAEKPDLALKKKKAYLEIYGRPEAEKGWHFLTGTEENIARLANSVGFHFKYDEKEKQYAHAAALFILTGTGVISRYLYGINWSPKDIELALTEASQGKISIQGVVDIILLFCCPFDPLTKKYSLAVFRVMVVGCLLTIFSLMSYLGLFWWRQYKKRKGASC